MMLLIILCVQCFVGAGTPPHTSNRSTCFFGPTRVHIPNGISIVSAIFAYIALYNGLLLFPSKSPLRMGDLDSRLIHDLTHPIQPFLQG